MVPIARRPSAAKNGPCLALCAACLITSSLAAQSSPIPAPEANDELFVVNQGPDLDTNCTYASGGPFVIELKVTRYVGETDSQGFLISPDELVAKGIVSAKARLRMPAFDVDSSAVLPGYQPEIDVVRINGHKLGTLSGLNNVWIMNEFEVPISFVKFPKRGTNGQPPQPAINTVTIEIDTGNSSNVWCTSIDWVSLSAKAMHPVFLVHGFLGGPDTWVPAFTSQLTTERIPFEHQIQLPKTGAIATNAATLATKLTALAKEFGVGSAHLIVHSKGGLDSRRYLSTHYKPDDLSILTLTTLSTPHHGSILADLAVAYNENEDAKSADPELDAFLEYDSYLFAAGFTQPALGDLQVSVAAEFNAANALPNGVQLYTVGADADLNDDSIIQDAEATGSGLSTTLAKLTYEIVATTASITVQNFSGGFLGLDEWSVVTPVTTAPKLNDLIVTNESAQHPSAVFHVGPLNANHGSIKSTVTASTVLAFVKAAFPVSSN